MSAPIHNITPDVRGLIKRLRVRIHRVQVFYEDADGKQRLARYVVAGQDLKRFKEKAKTHGLRYGRIEITPEMIRIINIS